MSENNTKARAAMVRHLAAAIRLRGLQTAEAAAWLDVPQEKIEAMQRGDADTFSLAELEAMAQAGERRETEPQIPADTVFHLALYERLQPHSEWRGGRLADTDLLTLEEAAAFASKHAGEEITARDFLRAAGRGKSPCAPSCTAPQRFANMMAGCTATRANPMKTSCLEAALQTCRLPPASI